VTEPFIAEIRIVGFNFAPTGWATCDGQILSISQNTALFALLGTTYGGNGQTNFALPNLQGRAPLFWGQGPGLSNYVLGQSAGTDNVTLLSSELPAHSHGLQATTDPADSNDPTNAFLAKSSDNTFVALSSPNAVMNPQAISLAGGSQPHNNLQPYLTLNFIIALAGVFPPHG
jgi:microcystin-dependent protein